MRKKYILGITILSVIVLVLIAINYKPIYLRLYPFDRITGTHSIEVNGQSVISDEYYTYENDDRCRLTIDENGFKIPGGKYGLYKIGFVVSKDELYNATGDTAFLDKEDIELSVSYFNTNWWHITNMSIDIDIVEENNEWYVIYDIDYTEPLEEGRNISDTISRKIKLDELEKTEITFGI